MNIRKYFLVMLMLASVSLFGQNDASSHKNVPIASPTAASLGKYADIPVSYYNGTPNIDIPIYTIQEGPLKVPISLSYHASGLKVMEQSSWVGAGWALNAGGVITRTVRGTYDESAVSDPFYLQDRGFFSYLYASNSTPQRPILDYVMFGGGHKDGEADLFFFNFNGYTGKFYFRADKTPVILPQQDLRIDPLFCPNNNANCNQTNENLYGFVVTTPDGVRYTFGMDLANPANPPVERNVPYSFSTGPALSSAKVIASWYLYKIESPDLKFHIDLTYSREDYSYYTVSSYPVLNGTGGVNLAKSYIFGQRLNTITFSNGQVQFVPDDAVRQDLSSGNMTTPQSTDWDNSSDLYPAKGLKSIQISTTVSGASFCKKFDLTKSYFSDATALQGNYGTATNPESPNNIHSDKKRLKLDAITEKSCDGTVVKPPHSFTYFEPESVPRTLSLAQDHWGFFNGATSNTTLMPDIAIDGGWVFSTGGANREAAYPAMRAGTLSRITYPTGGTTDLTFQPHNVWVNKKYYSQLPGGWDVNATGTGSTSTSTIYTIQVNTPTMFKYRAQTVGGGDGVIYFGSNSLGSTNWAWQSILMQAGTYTFKAVSSGGQPSQGIMAELRQLEQHSNYESVTVGGLRISSMRTSTADTPNDIIQTFDYTDNHNTIQGILFSRPSYVGLAKNYRMMESGIASGYELGGSYTVNPTDGCVATNVFPGTIPNYYSTPSSLHPMRTTQGGHIGYNQVKVTQADGGYTIYQFRLDDSSTSDVCVRAIDRNYCDPAAPNYPGAPDPVDPSRGELRGTYVFNSNNDLLKTTLSESTFANEPVGVQGLIVTGVGSFYYATEYETKTYRKTKSTTLELSYNAANPSQLPVGTITEIYYSSTFHNQETKRVVSEVVSGDMISNVVKGKVLAETRSSYIADLTTSTCDPDYLWNTTYASDIASCQSTFNAAVGGSCDYTCRFNAWQQLTYCINEKRKAYVTSKSSYELNKDWCLTNKANAVTGELKALFDLKRRNQIDGVIESSQWRDGKFLQSSYTTFQDVASNRIDIYPVKLEMINQDPQFSSTFTAATNGTSSITRDSKYTPASATEETYTYSGGVISSITPKNKVVSSYLWGYGRNYPIAEVKNAQPGDIAYSGFEESTNGGGWTYTLTANSDRKAGKKSHELTSGSMTRSGLTASTTYQLSYWAKGGTPTIGAGVQSSNDALAAEPDGWRYFEKKITGVTSVTLSATGGTVLVDEVKLAPAGALMTTYSYDPLYGIISQTDPNGLTQHYSYDKLGRLVVVKDRNKNVVQKTEYNYKSH